MVISVTEIEAQSPNFEGLVSKLNRLERDIQMLNRQLHKGDPKAKVVPQMDTRPQTPGSSYIIRMEDRLAELKSELQSTTNLAESINHNVEEMKALIDKFSGDISFRLDRLERGLVLSEGGQKSAVTGSSIVPLIPRIVGVKQVGPSAGGPIVSSGKAGVLGTISEENLSAIKQASPTVSDPRSIPSGISGPATSLLPKGSPLTQYSYAFKILQKANYAKAELAFKEFIQIYPKNKLTPNARYWLGETFYVRANYRDAAEAFLRGYQQSTRGPKAPDTLLKLGMSLANLKNKEDACATFNKLSKDFPNASVNIKATLKRQFGRAGCK